MTATEHVILVDEYDNEIGTAEKLAAHRDNLCHRAFSIFVFRQREQLEVLLQQRAKHKYHSPLLWTNTCCSHPRPGEDILEAGNRRLLEEMGFTLPLQNIGSFHYIAPFNNGLVENEIDHVLVGFFEDASISPNYNEVAAYKWISLSSLKTEIQCQPDYFTPWLGKALKIIDQSDLLKFKTDASA